MLIDQIAECLMTSPAYQTIYTKLTEGESPALGVAQSVRPLIAASVFTQSRRPMLVVVSGEETAARMTHTLSAYVGKDRVYHLTKRTDLPWSDKPSIPAEVGMRCEALHRLNSADPCIVVSSARALLRCVPPVQTTYYQPLTLQVDDELSFDDLRATLVSFGYEHNPSVDTPGSFWVHGDVIDIFGAQMRHPLRVECFDTQIERIRTMVASTGQTIGDLSRAVIYPCKELALTDAARKKAQVKLFQAAQDSEQVKRDLALIDQGVFFPHIDQYLGALYAQPVSPLDHLPPQTLVVLSEPRALFDDCIREYDELSARAHDQQKQVEGLYLHPKDLDFNQYQTLTCASIMRAGGKLDAELETKRPQTAQHDDAIVARLRGMINQRWATLFSVVRPGARDDYALLLSDAHLPFQHHYDLDKSAAPLAHTHAAQDSSSFSAHLKQEDDAVQDGKLSTAKVLADLQSSTSAQPLEAALRPGVVTITDVPISSSVIIPSARLGILTASEVGAQAAQQARQQIDITQITFPFKPGDYVVHANYGVGFFKEIVRMDVEGYERDYFLLEYAAEDKLYVPFERVDYLTRYVGPDASKPRLTRLHAHDWARVSARARKNAKKLAFDLVDLYTRRNLIQGHACDPDTAVQREMEADFAYEPTPDQVAALRDIKADMEAARPMDRLLCGDVGFGKTEVALRAAFKAVENGRQVMVLCPTTILAQQHFQTFFERFAPYDVEVEVLSRFRTPAQQRRAIEGFANGSVQVLIGTHRLLSNDVNPRQLGLIIIDEEQRFGVQHKEQLKTFREQVDVLTLSATPIPRTMQMAISGVRDMSLITTPPKDRRQVQVHVGEYDSDVVSDAIRRELARKGQVYYVSNRVRTIEAAHNRIVEAAPEARVGIAHGQLSERALEQIMEQFVAGEFDVLLATTIIESGIDNPHTNTLIIEDAHRLGLAQLYQLKGRVGRGQHQAYAYFMFPASESLSEQAASRLMAIDELTDLGSGMKIAMRDLEIRGAGSLMGAEQHGNLSSVGFDLFTSMLAEAVEAARGNSMESVQATEVTINLSVDYYLSDDYVPLGENRVLIYRKLAAATALSQVEELERQTAQVYGQLPNPAQNLFNRTRLRIRATRLGIASIALVNGKITIQGVELSADQATRAKAQGALYYVKSHKLIAAPTKDRANILLDVLNLVTQLGGDDEEEAVGAAPSPHL